MNLASIWARLYGDDSPGATVVRVNQVVELASSTPALAAGNIINSSLTAGLFYTTTPLPLLAGWVALVWLLSAAHLRSWWRNRRRSRPNSVGRRPLVRSTFWSAAAGVIWGLMAFILLQNNEMPLHVFVAFVVGGQAAVAAIWIAPLPAAGLAYILPSMIPVVAWFAMAGDFPHLAIAGLLITYTGVLILFMNNAYRKFVEVILAGFERERLVVQLETAHAQLEARVRQRTAELSGVNRRLEQEIGERRLAEEELRENQQMLRTVIDTIPDRLSLQDREGNRVLVNRSASEYFTKYAKSDSLPAGDYSYLDKRELPVIKKNRKLVLEQGQTLDFERERKLADGTEEWIHMRWVPLRGGGNVITGSLLVVTDITERKQAEGKLRESERRAIDAQSRLMDAIESIPEGFIMYDADERFVLCNSRYRDFFPQIEEMLVPGSKLEDVARTAFERGAVLQAINNVEEWLDIRLQEHRLANGTHEQQLSDGRWLLCAANKTSGGDTVGIRMDISQLKQQEEQLRAGERLLQAVFDVIPHWIFVKDKNSRYMMVNNAFAESYGLRPKDFKGKHTLEMPTGTEEELALFVDTDRQVLESGAGLNMMAYPATLPDGRRRISHSHKLPFRDEAGNIIGVVGVLEDVTERTHAEAELRLSEERFAAVVNNSPAVITMKDLDLKFTLANREFEEKFSVSVKEIVGLGVHDMFPKKISDALEAHDREVINSGQAISREHPIVRNHQDIGVYLSTKFPVMDDGGKLVGVGAIAWDITDLREAEKALRMAQFAIDKSADAIFWIDPDGRLVYVNDTACGRLGYSRDELLNMSVPDIDPNISRKTWAKRWKTLEEQGSHFLESIHRTKDGRDIPVDISVSHINFGDQAYHCSVARDITGRKQAEQEIHESESRIRLIMDSVPALIAYINADQRYEFGNKQYLEWFGITPKKLIGKQVREVVGDAAYVNVLPNIESALSGIQVTDNLEFPHISKGMRHTRASYVPKFADDGSVPGYFLIAVDVHSLHQAEEELRYSQNLLRSVVDAIPHHLFLKDANGRYQMVNRSFGDYWEIDPDHPADRNTKNLPVAEKQLAAFFRDTDRKVLQTGQTVDENFLFKRKDGADTFRRQIKVPFRNQSGEIVGIIGLSEDITERGRAEESLAASEEKYRHLIQGSLQGIMVHRDFNLLFANQAYANIFGFDTPEELLAVQDHRKFFTPNELVRVQKYYRARIRDKKVPERYEFQGIRKDGAMIWVENMAKKVMWDGEPAIQAFCIDVSERKRAEQELRSSQRLLRTVIDTIPHWVFAKDMESRYLLVNHAMCTSLGLTPQSIIGQETQEIRRKQELRIGTDEELAALVEMDRHVMETGKSVEEEDFTLTGPGGTQRIHHILKMPLLDESGESVGVVGMSENITERKELERQLRQSQKMEAVGQLAGGMAHDFNNMLQIIISYAYLARGSENSPENLRKYLDNIGKGAGRAANLTRQLLTFSRKDVLQPQILDIDNLISNLMNMLGRLLGESIEMEILPGSELHAVNADPGMLEQVLVNLSINARDAMPGGGRLVIETSAFHADEEFCRVHGWRRPGEYLLISLSDTGEGMTAVVREHIFEPFYTTKEPGKGTGLGLSMVYSIIEQHDGIITVYSDPGVGTSFRIYLPAIEGETSTQEEQESRETPAGTETILIAEDEESVRELLCALLRAKGYQVLVASDGEQAVSVYSSCNVSIDLVIMDVMMPKLSGRKAFDQIRVMDGRVPVVFSTGYAAGTLDKDFLEKNGLRVIHKPYEPALLYQAVREAIDGTSESSRTNFPTV